MATFMDTLLSDPSFLTGVSLLGGQNQNIGQNILGVQGALAQQNAARQLAAQRQQAMDDQATRRLFNPGNYIQDGKVNVPGMLSTGIASGYDPQEIAQMAAALQRPTAKYSNVAPGGSIFNETTGQVEYQAPFKPPEIPSQIREMDVLRERLRHNPNDTDAIDMLGKITGADAKQAAVERATALADQREALNEQRAEARKQKDQQFVDTQVGKLQDDLVREQVPQMTPVMKGIQNVLTQYPKGDLPGFSKKETLLANSGMGALNNEEAQRVRQAIMPLANITIKVRSGAAVTQQEWDRFREELGSKSFMSPERIRQGLKMFQEIYGSTLKGVGAGYSDDVVNAYENRFKDVSFGRKSTAPASGGARRYTKEEQEAAKAVLRQRGLLQ